MINIAHKFASMIFVTFSLSALAGEKSAAVIDNPAFTRAQRLVSIEPGRRLNIYCTGSGSPTVIFDSGLGDGTKAWGLIQPVIASTTGVCSYDRAGLGFSDPSSRPGTSANAIDDLHRLLRAANIKPPYVLVGHSFGGMNVKLYALTFPSDVVGMVFVDATHENLGKMIWGLDPNYEAKYGPFMERLSLCLMAEPADFVEGSDLFDNCIPQPSPRYSAAINATEIELGKQLSRRKAWISEQEHIWYASSEQLRAAHHSLGDIPLIVLTKEPAPPGKEETQELRDAKNQGWIILHDEIAAMSSRGKRRTISDSGHYIQQDQPQAVNEAILEIVHAARDQLPDTN